MRRFIINLLFAHEEETVMDTDAAKVRILQANVNNKEYTFNIARDNEDIKKNFIAVLVLLFESKVCSLENTNFDNEFCKLINDLSYGILIKSFDEVESGVFIRPLHLFDSVVKVKLTKDTVKIIGFFSQDSVPYDGRYMFS